MVCVAHARNYDHDHHVLVLEQVAEAIQVGVFHVRPLLVVQAVVERQIAVAVCDEREQVDEQDLFGSHVAA